MNPMLDWLADSDRIVVIVHTHADMDSVGSAVALATTLDSPADIATPSIVRSRAVPLLEDATVVTSRTSRENVA